MFLTFIDRNNTKSTKTHPYTKSQPCFQSSKQWKALGFAGETVIEKAKHKWGQG